MTRFISIFISLSFTLLTFPTGVQAHEFTAQVISVDTVNSLGSELPEMDGDRLRGASFRYHSMMMVAGQSVDLEVSRSISEAYRDGHAVWRLVEHLVMPVQFGGMATVDTFDLDRETLLPIARHSESMGTIRLDYAHDRITGTLSGAGQEIPVDVPLDQPIMADGAGLDVSIAAMPLTMGYSATLRFLSPLQQSISSANLVVEDEESVSVGAGDFDVFRLTIAPASGSEGPSHTIYALRDAPHFVVRSVLELPASMGGGSMTSELEWLD